MRLNKSFIISRSGNTKKEIYNNLMGASKYIFQLLSTKNLVWIAQRQGRSKDGIDKTARLVSERGPRDLVIASK